MGKGEAATLLSAAGAATAIGGAYKLSEFLYKAKRIRDVGPANAVFVRLINRVRQDLEEVHRLLTVPECKKALEANPPKAKWVYGAIRDVRGALENITPHTERVAGDIDDGRRVGLRHRVYWLLSEKEKLENREKELATAHSSLTEVIGFLTAIEPIDEKEHAHNTRTDIDFRRGRPEGIEERDVWVDGYEQGPRRVEERETWIEQERGPRRVEERDIYIERERGPHRVEERDVYIEREGGPRRIEEREIYVDERGPRRYDEHEYIERREPYYAEERHHEDVHHDPRGRIEERELHVERDPRDPRHVEASYYERGPGRYTEQRYEERRVNPGPGRRPESFEDRVPERETFMQSDVRRSGYGRSPYGEYAEYGAPQPSGAAEYRLPLMNRDYEREVWIEEKEDYRYDKYGNKLPEPFQGTRYPQYPRSRV